jgi:tetratricopeptide (TPR) repeat protein
MDEVVRVAANKERESPVAGHKALGVALLFWVFLFYLPPSTIAQTDSDHIQQAFEMMSTGDLVGAEQEARLALRDSSTRPGGWAALGMVRARQKRYADATECFHTALRLEPRLVDAHLGLGEVDGLTGKTAQAREEFRSVLRRDPGNRDALFGLAQLESTTENFSASLTAAEPILADLHRSSPGILLLAKDYAGLKQKDPLAALVPSWSVLPRVSASDSTAFSALLAKSGLDQQALAVLEKAKASGQVSVELALALANQYFSKGDLTQAFESYEAALTLKPNCVDCLRQLAKIAEQQKDPEKALAYLIKAKRQQPDDPEILFEFGKACLELDLFEDAVPALERASRSQPDNDSYAYVLASAHVSKKEYDAAGKIFERLLQKHPRDPILNYAMGSLLFLEVKLEQAEPYLRKSVELNPDQSGAYYYLGLIAEGKAQDEQALATFKDVLRRDPNYAPACEAMGRILLKEQKFPEAQQALEKAVLLNPSSVKAHYQLGILLGRTGKQEDAKKELAIVNELNAEETKRAGMRLRILTDH